MSNEREQWGSKLGFIFAAAGSAVGIGNIWKFPSFKLIKLSFIKVKKVNKPNTIQINDDVITHL